MSKKSSKIRSKQILLQIFGYSVALGLLWWLFAVKLPTIIDFNDVRRILTGLSLLQLIVLIGSGLGVMLVLGWTSKSTLPGLSLRDATEASATAQATSVILPVPFDLLMRLSMYQTYGFSASKSTASVVVAGVVRYFAMIFVPIAGLVALLITGQAFENSLALLLFATILAGGAGYILIRMVNNKTFANKIAILGESAINALRKIFKKRSLTTIKPAILNFVNDIRKVVSLNARELVFSHVAWALSLYAVFFICIRFCGINADVLSWAQILFITGVMLLLSAVPLIPGGIGFTEVILLSLVSFNDPQSTAAFASALLLYRVITWVMPIPIGAGAFFVWRTREKAN